MKVKPTSLFNNSRFYIICFSLLLSVAVFAYLRLIIASDELLAIRTQQVYGFLCLGFWYLALIISPIGHVIGKEKVSHLAFARRAIGVSAFYFAALHGAIALFGQLGGIANLVYLPDVFKWSLAFGAISLLILGLMAATSFDKVVKFMTFRKWKWLHRFVYAAGVLAVLHIWLIGTHLAYSWVQIVSVVALAILLGLELFVVSKKLNEKYFKLGKSENAALFLTMWAVAVGLLLALPALAQNYHSKHNDHVSARSHDE